MGRRSRGAHVDTTAQGLVNWLSNLREISPWPCGLHVPPDVLKLKGKASWELRILSSPYTATATVDVPELPLPQQKKRP